MLSIYYSFVNVKGGAKKSQFKKNDFALDALLAAINKHKLLSQLTTTLPNY